MRLYRVRQSACVALATAALCVTATTADASLRRHRHHTTHSIDKTAPSTDRASPSGIETSGRYADFVVDAKTGRVLHATNADAPRHPASLTKMMTLYILFEELERGRFTMDSGLTVSKHASLQSPTKLDLRAGEQISVSDAIHGLVTQSANDAAVTIGENIAGSEEAFAKRMTQTAHRIGMSNTYFYNASGLPNAEQYTTARDIVTLGRALQERFPENYKVFSTRSFAYHGRVYGNHNHLLGRLDGIDGIKTGYTEASGFNLVTSIHRDGHFIVAAVLGGSSGGSRDAQMVRLVEANLPDSSTGPHVASVFSDAHMAARDGDEKPNAPIVTAVRDDPMPAPRVKTPDVGATPVAVVPKVEIVTTKPVRPRLVDHPVVAEKAAPKFDDHAASLIMAKAILAEQKHKQVVASLDDFMPAAPAAKPSIGKQEAPAVEKQVKAEADIPRPRVGTEKNPPKPDTDRGERLMTASLEPIRPTDRTTRPTETTKSASTMPAAIHEGWLIQIAAVDNANDAKSLLARAKSVGGDKLAAGTPVTEAFLKGNATLYRARFTGFSDQKTADAACSSLKRKDFACLVIRQ